MTIHHSYEQDFDTLFHKEKYTVEEVAYLLNRSPSFIASAIWSHKLPASMAGHDIISIRRHDLLEWLESGGHDVKHA
jgi:excisionase family DNA binding protein